jgi:hypothetical protein
MAHCANGCRIQERLVDDHLFLGHGLLRQVRVDLELCEKHMLVFSQDLEFIGFLGARNHWTLTPRFVYKGGREIAMFRPRTAAQGKPRWSAKLACPAFAIFVFAIGGFGAPAGGERGADPLQ